MTTVAPRPLDVGATGAPPAPSLPVPAAPPRSRERLVALDVFRGLTIAGMLLVNHPGSWGAIYAPLEHARWNGWTPTDLIFPFFLFIIGITTELSRESRRARGASDGALVRQTVRRGAIIVALGLLLSAFPTSLDFSRYPSQLATMRFPGVLQRIGVAYAAAALITLRTTARQQIALIAALLLGYWALLTLVPVPGVGLGLYTLGTPSSTLAAYVDRLVFGAHLWAQSRTWDPEGLLSTIPAIGTTLLGVLAGRWIRSPRPLAERLAALYAVGSLAAVAGLIWNWFFPINKSLWTSSYVLFTAGMAALTLATCIWLVDVKRSTWWTRPFVVFGLNPIAAYVGAGLLARLLYTTVQVRYGGEVVSLQAAIYRSLFAPWLAPRNASLLFALVIVLFWLGAMWVLYRRKIFLKV